MLDNLQIDAYLEKHLKRLELIRSCSYDHLFTHNGKIKPEAMPQGFTPSKFSYGVILNMDKETGPGLHWVCLVLTPSIIFYYDPLLPNKEYEIPDNVSAFLESRQIAGMPVLINYDADQAEDVRIPGQGIKRDEMCGAYSTIAMMMLDNSPTPATFFKIHERLKDKALVYRIYREMGNS